MDQKDGISSDDWRRMNTQMRERAGEQRRHSAQLADRLSQECMQQAQRSIEGLLSIPTTFALGIASTTLYAASLLERGFETVQITMEALRSGIEQGRQELQQGAQEPRLSGEARPS